MDETMPVEKKCLRCGFLLPLTSFPPHKKGKYGLYSLCKECSRAYGRENYKKNAETIKLRKYAWNKAHPEIVATIKREYQRKNKHRISEAKKKAYRKWYVEKGGKEKVYFHKQKRRELESRATRDIFNPKDIFERDCWVCQICGKRVNKRLKHPNALSPTLDHIVPLIRGGEHTKRNVRLVHFRCNLEKGVSAKMDQLRIF